MHQQNARLKRRLHLATVVALFAAPELVGWVVRRIWGAEAQLLVTIGGLLVAIFGFALLVAFRRIRF